MTASGSSPRGASGSGDALAPLRYRTVAGWIGRRNGPGLFGSAACGLLNVLVTLPGHDQSTYRLRMEWGPTGAAAVPADYAVVVDVLSFTTTLSVAIERGIEVFPFRWRDSRAAEHAVRHGATLAVGRFEALSRGGARHVSLSPASLAEVEGVERLVLPSPNGSTISFALAEETLRSLTQQLNAVLLRGGITRFSCGGQHETINQADK